MKPPKVCSAEKKNPWALVYSFVRSISKDLENILCLFFRPDLRLDLSFTNRGLLLVFLLLKKWNKESATA